MDDKIIEKTEEALTKKLDEGLNTNNLEIIYKLKKINHMAKEDKNMNYGNYGNYGNYNEYDGYGARSRDSRGRYNARGYDARYRGYDHLDRMSNDYGRYMESRERYGANEETDKSFHYMNKSLEEFIKYLFEEAETPQQKQMLRETLQKSMM